MADLHPVRVHLLPPTDGLRASHLAVIVDVLRASTTITAALSAGADSVCPCAELEVARTLAAGQGLLLCGERGGVRPEGFDLGNSPLEYTSESVGGRSLAFTTTNGTRALQLSLDAGTIVIGAFVNFSAVVARCRQTAGPVDIVCAGTDGCISAEDVLFAGWLASELVESGTCQATDDSTRIAMDFCRSTKENPERLPDAVRGSQGGRNLVRLGYDADIQFAATIDRFSLVPTYRPDSGQIVPAVPGP